MELNCDLISCHLILFFFHQVKSDFFEVLEEYTRLHNHINITAILKFIFTQEHLHPCWPNIHWKKHLQIFTEKHLQIFRRELHPVWQNIQVDKGRWLSVCKALAALARPAQHWAGITRVSFLQRGHHCWQLQVTVSLERKLYFWHSHALSPKTILNLSFFSFQNPWSCFHSA